MLAAVKYEFEDRGTLVCILALTPEQIVNIDNVSRKLQKLWDQSGTLGSKFIELLESNGFTIWEGPTTEFTVSDAPRLP